MYMPLTILARVLSQMNGLQMIVRAHECVMDGFERFAQGHLITLFSATNYCGTANNAGNHAGYITLNSHLSPGNPHLSCAPALRKVSRVPTCLLSVSRRKSPVYLHVPHLCPKKTANSSSVHFGSCMIINREVQHSGHDSMLA